ncbi:hypothetical protein OG763_22510 [Streptomyces sp. NBC_01230]|uniref:hypothetical protein n=1 Tax=unclassified Streptomyces TaxID=2593676 RepID=UPI002E1002E7|nr:hypothetical protein OG763_22510 [Streptomyces sp. NBC_01230]
MGPELADGILTIHPTRHRRDHRTRAAAATRHCAHDLGALGHDSSGLPGSKTAGMGAHNAGFPAGELVDRGVRVVDPDSYLCGLYRELPHEVVEAVVGLIGEKRNPPVTIAVAIARLA